MDPFGVAQLPFSTLRMTLAWTCSHEPMPAAWIGRHAPSLCPRLRDTHPMLFGNAPWPDGKLPAACCMSTHEASLVSCQSSQHQGLFFHHLASSPCLLAMQTQQFSDMSGVKMPEGQHYKSAEHAPPRRLLSPEGASISGSLSLCRLTDFRANLPTLLR